MSSESLDNSLLCKVAMYTEILAKDPHSTAFVPLSDAYRQMKLHDDALEVALKGVQAQPHFSPGFVILGRIQFEMGDVSSAAVSFEQAYRLDPVNGAAISGLARVLTKQGDTARARDLLTKALALNPNDAAAARMLASLPAAASPPTGRPEEAGKSKEPIATSTIAEIYLKQGFPERALKVYLDLQTTHPDNPELKKKIAELVGQIRGERSVLPAAHETAPPSSFPTPEPPLPPKDASPVTAVDATGDRATAVDRQLAVLHRWLDAIETRREHVQ